MTAVRPQHRHFWTYRTDGAGHDVSVCRCGDTQAGRWQGERRVSGGHHRASLARAPSDETAAMAHWLNTGTTKAD